MGGSVIQLQSSQIEAVATDELAISARFAPAMLVKSEGVPGVDASTLWRQAAVLSFQNGEIEGELPSFPARLAGGKLTVNRVSYVDMIPIPLDSAGFIQLVLNFVEAQGELAIIGTGATLELVGPGQYIQHLPAA
jgi:hypothetical protein